MFASFCLQLRVVLSLIAIEKCALKFLFSLSLSVLKYPSSRRRRRYLCKTRLALSAGCAHSAKRQTFALEWARKSSRFALLIERLTAASLATLALARARLSLESVWQILLHAQIPSDQPQGARCATRALLKTHSQLCDLSLKEPEERLSWPLSWLWIKRARAGGSCCSHFSSLY